MPVKSLLCLLFAASAALSSPYLLDSTSFSLKSPLRNTKGVLITPVQGSRFVPEKPVVTEAGRLYLRRRTGSAYGWYPGQPSPEALRTLRAFSLKEKGLTPEQAVWIKFYSRRADKAFRDEQDIYFDQDFIYSPRVTTLYMQIDGQWDEVKALDVGIGGFELMSAIPLTVLFRTDTLGNTPMGLPAVIAGLHYARLEAEGHMPWVIGFQVLPGQVVRREVALPAIDALPALPPRQADSVRIHQGRDLVGLEPLQDALLAEDQALKVLEQDRRLAFEKSYPALVAAPPGVDEWGDAGYIAYKEAFLLARRDAMVVQMGPLSAVRTSLDAHQAFLNTRMDSLHALNTSIVLKPEAVRVQIQDSVTGRARLEIKFRSADGRHDAAWSGSYVDTIPAQSIAQELLDSASNTRIRLQYQNHPVRILQAGQTPLRRHYRYARLELERLGPGRELAGTFILPKYILDQPEVQQWLARGKTQPTSRVREDDARREEEIRLQKIREEEELLRRRYRGDVVEIQGSKFRYRGKLVSMSPFAIQRTEVTQEHYQRISLQNPSTFKGPRKPVHQVNWSQAREFCKLVGGDLPSQAQWEFAARAGADEGLRWTAGDSQVEDFAVFAGNSLRSDPKSSYYGPQAVGVRKANSWGLFDMAGNVAEWTRDRYSMFSFYVESKDPTGASVGHFRVFKGGSWRDEVKKLSASASDEEDPRYRSDYMGVRCVFPAQQILHADSLRKFFDVRDSLARAKGLVSEAPLFTPVDTGKSLVVEPPVVPQPATPAKTVAPPPASSQPVAPAKAVAPTPVAAPPAAPEQGAPPKQ